MLSSLRIAIERTASRNFSGYSIIKDGRRLKKMVDRMSQKKKSPQFSPTLLTKSTQEVAYDNEGSSKRLVNLNKLYMEELSVMINVGMYRNELSKLGVQITRVKMAKGLNFLNIHWITLNKSIDEDNVNQVLSKTLGELQEKLGSIRFTSKVPLLRFVRDKRLENELHLEEIFKSADFGKGFKPIYESKVFTQDYVHRDMKFPEMRQDVLGLDHAKIKNSIESKILKFKAIDIEWIDKEELEEEQHSLPEKLIVFSQKEFYKFYKRRRILELKMKKKLENKFTPNDILEYFDEDPRQEEDDEDYYKYFEKYDLDGDNDDHDNEKDEQDFR